MKKKSGKIELLRFLFSLMIIFHHMNLHFWDMKLGYNGWIFSKKGYIGVEFFFLVSGFLMAASMRKMPKDTNVIKGSINFVWRKIKAILPYHIPLYIGTLFALSLGDRTLIGLIKNMVYHSFS